jgi:hypothetical protein
VTLRNLFFFPIHWIMGTYLAELDVSDEQMNDLGHPHPGKTEAEHHFVALAHIGTVADAKEVGVCLGVGQPPGGVLALELPVERRSDLERVVAALQLLHQGRIGFALAHAPAQLGADPSQAVAAGVVGPPLSDPVVDGRVGQSPGMGCASVGEQGGELGPVLLGRLRVGVPAHEPFDEFRAIRMRVVVNDYAKRSYALCILILI